MAVTRFQAEVLKRIARSRIKNGETYVAGGLALNYQLGRPRLSSDIDVFNNSYDALVAAAAADRAALVEAGYTIDVKRERDFIIEVTASKGGESTDLQWVQDAASKATGLRLVAEPYDEANPDVGGLYVERRGLVLLSQ